jgi:hypothetical protein
VTRKPFTPSAPWPLVGPVYCYCDFTRYPFTAGFFHRVTRLGRECAATVLEGL